MDRPIVAIVGRPNVGKSTLFNRIVGQRLAIVEDVPGITRDRLYAEAEWRGRQFVVTDTGGILFNETDPLTVQVSQQAQLAMDEADVILFVVDATAGITGTDETLADELRKTNVPVILVANKVDNEKLEQESVEFYQLGLGEVYPVSSVHGRGLAEALDMVIDAMKSPSEEEAFPSEAIRLSIVGRPNVGKSSIVNAILGEERVIVSNIPGTTRDAIDTIFKHGGEDGQEIVLIDTAGIRRSGKIQGSVEYYTVLRAVRALERSDVAMLVIDAEDGVTDGDKRVGGYIHKSGRGCVIVANKWDLKKGKMSYKEFTAHVRKEMAFLDYAPVVFVSAKEGWGLSAAVDTAVEAAANHARRIPTGEINRIIQDAVDDNPLARKGKQLKIKYATMPAVKPPTIILFVNDTEIVHFSYIRYLENQIRKVYGYEGTPLRIIPRKAEKERD
ncbi:MAG: ribosome biogenesis GTPase Der [Armatimonadota bacterium]